MGQRLFENAFTLGAKLRVLRPENHPDAIAERLRQGEAPLVALGGEELVRNLKQDARPVAGGLIGAGRPAVGQVDENLLAVFNDGVIARAVDVDHGPDAARIVLVLRFVQTLIAQTYFHWVPRTVSAGERGRPLDRTCPPYRSSKALL